MSYRLKPVVATASLIGILGICVYRHRKEIMEIATQVYELLCTGGEYLIPRIDLDNAEDVPDIETNYQNDSEDHHEVTEINTDENSQSNDVIRASSRVKKPISIFGLKLGCESIRSLFLEKRETVLSGDSKSIDTRNRCVQVLHSNDQLNTESNDQLNMESKDPLNTEAKDPLNTEAKDPLITRPSTSACRTDTEVIQVVRSLQDLFESQGPTGSATTCAILDTKDSTAINSVEYEMRVKFGNVRENFRNYNSGFVIYKYNSGVNVPEENGVKTDGSNEQCVEDLRGNCDTECSKNRCVESSSTELHTVYRKLTTRHSMIQKGELGSEQLKPEEVTGKVIDNVETFEQMKRVPSEMNVFMGNKNRLLTVKTELDDTVDEDEDDFTEEITQEKMSTQLNLAEDMIQRNKGEFIREELHRDLPEIPIQMSIFSKSNSKLDSTISADSRPTKGPKLLKFEVTAFEVIDNVESDTDIDIDATASEELEKVIELGDFDESEMEVDESSQYETVIAQSLTTNDSQITEDPAGNTRMAECSYIGKEYEAPTSRNKIRTLAELFEAKPTKNIPRPNSWTEMLP